MAMGGKQISSGDPDRADHRMITYLMRIHFRNKGKLNDRVYDLVDRVFRKAGGSWIKIFEGSSEDLDTLKKILKIGMKKGLIPKKKKASQEIQAVAKGISDLAEGFYVIIAKGGNEVFFKIKGPNIVLGGLTIFKNWKCNNVWVVDGSWAEKGWGPFLYDLALEYVGSEGLMPDRGQVSGSARKIWEYYYKRRSDVKKYIMEEDSQFPICLLHKESYLNCIYEKQSKVILPYLKQHGKIKEFSEGKTSSVKKAVAKSISDLIEGFHVISRDYNPNAYFGLYSNSKIIGEILIEKNDDCNGVWEVSWSEAEKGWGPFLYDLALEHAGKIGLIADRGNVSEEARRIWRYYFKNRSDVSKYPIMNDSDFIDCDKHEEKGKGGVIDYVYLKKKQTLLPLLRQMGKIKEV